MDKRTRKQFERIQIARKDMKIEAFIGNLHTGEVKREGAKIYVTIHKTGQVLTVRNVRVPNNYGYPVYVGYLPDSPVLQVISGREYFGSSPLPMAGEHDHTWGTSSNPAWIRKEQILDGLPVPIGGMIVKLFGYWFYLNDAFHVVNTQEFDLSSYVPASDARWVSVEIDETGIITYNEGLDYANRTFLDDPATLPITPSDKKMLFAVKTYAGQTEILHNYYTSDIFDPRFTGFGMGGGATPSASGGGGGTPGGSDTEVQYNNGGAFGGDVEFTWDDITKTLGIGDPAGLPAISPDHTFWLVGDGISPSQFMVSYGSGFAPFTTFMKADGSAASPANVKDDQVIGRIRGRGYDGTGWTDTRIEIRFVADGDWSNGDTPTRIELWTCPDGSGTLTLAMTIGSDGNVNIASGKTYNINGSPHTHSHTALTDIGTLTHAQLDITVPLQVKNTSGATANANDVGYLIYTAGSGYEYKTTTTAIDNKPACVVLVGGANNSTIYVVNRGRFTIPYTSTAPSAGDFLVFSTVAGSVQRNASMRPEVMAIAMAAGSGGTVDALLLTQTMRVDYYSANDVWRNNAHSNGQFTATINGAPTATSFVYTPVSGNEDILNVLATGQLAKLMVYNTTRSTYRLVTACNTGTNTVTNVSITDSWANGDSITVANATINDGLTQPYMGLDFSSQSEIPALARAVILQGGFSDTGGAGQVALFHPYVAYSVPKILTVSVTQTTQQLPFFVIMPLIDQKFGMRTLASGTGTKLSVIKSAGYFLAIP